MKNFLKEASSYIIIILIVILFRSFIATPVKVDGPSMNDTLNDKELLLLSKISYVTSDIERYDIVVIQNGNEKIIKRVYGLPGDKVEYRNNILYINNEVVEDKYATNETSDFTIKDICIAKLKKDKIVSNEEIEKECTYDTILDNYYLVLGDNRKVSADSRFYGLIPKENIVGKATFRFWPLDRIGKIE